MAEKVTCEIFIAMNEDGGWVVTDDESTTLERLAEDQGGYHARVVKIAVKMTPPVMTEAEVDVPAEAGQTQSIETTAE